MPTRCLMPILLVLLAGPAWAGEPWRPFEDATAETIPQLENLAEWCNTSRLHREWTFVLESILVLDPDHGPARRGLRYSRGRDGGWERRREYRRPKGTRPELLPEFERKREEILGDLVREVLEGLGERRAELDGPDRERILDGLAVLLPSDSGVRSARGEVRHEDRWILAETKNAMERAPALRRAARRLFAEQPTPDAHDPDAIDREIGLPWTAVFITPDVRVAGTVSRKELIAHTRLCGAVKQLFREVFEPTHQYPALTRVYVLDGETSRPVYLDRHPAMTAALRKFLGRVQSGWVDSVPHLGVWAGLPDMRHENISRQAISLLARHNLRIGMKHGAIHEGIGLYLSYLLTGERRVWFVWPGGYATGKAARFGQGMRKSGSDWLDLARSLVAGGDTPDYPALLGMDVNGMSPTDLLHAYVFGVYLVAGNPEGRAGFITASGLGTHHSEASLEHLGTTVPELERRVLRWLAETGELLYGMDGEEK